MSGPVYSQRPSKDVTRRIFIDLLHRLNKVTDLSEYQYVGFGALEFVDFDLVHRHLGLDRLVSIEKDPNLIRYEENKPYQSIELIGGQSSDVLAEIDWSGLNIVWLDYECSLIEPVFNDISYLCSKLVPGSVLAVTLHAQAGPLGGRRDRFAKNVGEHRVPAKVDDDTLGEWGWAEAQQRLIFSTIRNRLGKRVDQASWRQLLNVQYRDSARMQLIAGIVDTPGMKSLLDSCGFDKMEHTRSGPEALKIEVPYLTPLEQSILRRQLPRRSRQRQAKLAGVSAEDVKAFSDFYQWIGA